MHSALHVISSKRITFGKKWMHGKDGWVVGRVGAYMDAWENGEWVARYGAVVWVRGNRRKDFAFADINPSKRNHSRGQVSVIDHSLDSLTEPTKPQSQVLGLHQPTE